MKLSSDHVADITAADRPDLPDANAVSAEVDLWRKKWERHLEKRPSTLSSTIGHANPLIYPNISRILELVLVVPVTSGDVEHAHSILRFIKTDHRSTITESRLNALILMFCYKQTPLDLDAVLNRFATAHPRRMLLVNPMEED